MTNSPPQNWDDKDGWDCYFNAEISAGRTAPQPDFIVLRFLSFAREKGGRIWFPGCGLDSYPHTYAERGCKVLATDFASVAVKYQQRLAAAFLKENESGKFQGTLAVAERDQLPSVSGAVFQCDVRGGGTFLHCSTARRRCHNRHDERSRQPPESD